LSFFAQDSVDALPIVTTTAAPCGLLADVLKQLEKAEQSCALQLPFHLECGSRRWLVACTVKTAQVANWSFFVRNIFGGPALAVKMDGCSSVNDVLERLEEQTQGRKQWCKLIFAGYVLEPHRPLSFYNIPEAATIHLVVRKS
jgi:hypothetical protein